MTSQTNDARLPDATRIGRSALRVSDLDGLTDFYRTVVGLSVLDHDASTAVLGSDDTPLLVLQGDDTAPERPRSATGLYHNAFRVPSREALGDALARVRDDWRLDGASDHWVSEALYLTDPGGNGVEIYRDFPREEWPVTDGRVQMTTEPLDLSPIETAATGAASVPSGTDLGHVHLEVSSLAAFEEFYVDTLGFETQADIPDASFVSAGGYHHHIGANVWHGRTDPTEGRGLDWFEILVPETSALDAVRARLADREIPITETDDGLAVTDSDGIEVRLRVAP